MCDFHYFCNSWLFFHPSEHTDRSGSSVLEFFKSVNHNVKQWLLGFQTTFRVIFADDERKAVLIRGLETPF